MIKKLLLLLACSCLPWAGYAELKKVAVKKASATSEEGLHGNYEGPARFAVDGDPSTFWSSVWSDKGKFPVNLEIELVEPSHLDYVRYVPRTGNVNGNWDNVKVQYAVGSIGLKWETLGEYKLNGSSEPYTFSMGQQGIDRVKKLRFVVNSGANGFATAAEIEPLAVDNSMYEAWETYFADSVFSELSPEVTSSEGIEDPVLKALVDNLLTDAPGYSKFRVAQYEPYRNIYSLQNELKTSAPYNQWENPTGIYLKPGEECYVVVSGITTERVGLKMKNWVLNEQASTYSLMNGMNKITATTEGNVFVDYYTDNYQTAPNVKIHFVNAPVRGYWDKETMTNEDWKKMLAPLKANDSSIIIVRSQHAQLAYPVCSWKQHCPENVDSVMALYQLVQWAERDIMGLEKYGRQTKNRQLFFATTYGFMAAGGSGAYCNINSLGTNMTPDARKFGFWGIGHEWGHNNQIKGFKWSGCGETTNNIYASWAEILFNQKEWCRMEDEVTGIEDYAKCRGGRMQAHFEEGLRKGKSWQLQEGPDYYGTQPSSKTVADYDYDGNPTGTVTTTSRNYDHFVKLIPLWQLNLWGTLAGKSPDIFPMIIESIRNTPSYTEKFNTNGKQQMNIMKLACDSTRLNLLPFFERAGMLKPINAFIEDYGAGWIKINQKMIDELKAHVKEQGYAEVTEEVNYVNAHNYKTYRDCLPLQTPEQMGDGCTYANGKVKVLHSVVKNAVAFETYNQKDSLLRITMYGLASDDSHSFTQVLYPSSSEVDEAAAYIMAVGYDGTRKKIYDKMNLVKGLHAGVFYTITNVGRGNALGCGAATTMSANGDIAWNVERGAKNSGMDQIWTVEKAGQGYYICNPQTGFYLPGKTNSDITSLVTRADASLWEVMCVDEAQNEFTFKSQTINQFLNAHSATKTAYWSSGAGNVNSRWKVEEVNSVSITIPTSGYYTVCYPMALNVPQGVKIYCVGEIAKMNYEGQDYFYAILDSLEGTTIPARMPVMLSAAPGKYVFELLAQDNREASLQNHLLGSTLKITGLDRSSAMYDINISSEAGATAVMKFKISATTVPANRAYMLRSQLEDVKQLYIKKRTDVPTGLTDIEADVNDDDTVLYDLRGVRVRNPRSGQVYVTATGKKVWIQ